MIALSVIPVRSKAQVFTVTEEELRAANNAFRQRDSCNAAGFLLSVIAKTLDNQNKVLSDSSKIKDAQIKRAEKKIRNKNKIAIGSLIVNAIFFVILIL